MDNTETTNTNKTPTAAINSFTQERVTKSNAIQIPAISLPKGGGALKGIDEKFEVNSANGTAGFSIPLPITSGRNGFSPALALSYNSGGGNSPYGLGWSVGLPTIQRKTDKRLPRYRDGFEEDIFLFSGAEDLVPFLEKDGVDNWIKKEEQQDNFFITRYRPRIEGGFARIEKISHPEIGVYWKVTTRDNFVTIFGKDKMARIADPLDENKIFEWLPEFSYDDKGNCLSYHYKIDSNYENGTFKASSVSNAIYDKNRNNGIAPYTNTYLKKITYSYKKPFYADNPYNPTPPKEDYFFELVMDYGEHTNEIAPHKAISEWKYRQDAFSSYRSGFEIRTNRLCQRILLFHHFSNKEKQFDGSDFGKDYLVRSLDLTYDAPAGFAEVTYLTAITQSGYVRKSDGTYSKKSLPAMEFQYQELEWNKQVKTVSKENIVNAPVGLTNNYQWVDLYGEGIAGILSEQGAGWYYKRNFGDIKEDGNIAFDIAKKVLPRPSFSGLSNGVLSLQDLAANGEKQIVVNSGAIKGYFELIDNEEDWKPFRPFEQVANIDLQNPNTRLLDLNGDGQPDVVMTEETIFSWHAANGKKGHSPKETATKAFDEEKGPAIVFADALQTIFLADMSGDGLTDIVRIRNGEICYWANMGYGKFSAKVTMDNAPVFDYADNFNPSYLHLADVSGTGATDIIYLGTNKFTAYINLSGNKWSNAQVIENTFPYDSNARFSVIDLLGNGTSCIVWSSDLPANSNRPMRYIDLMSGKKPHVMKSHKNNFGKTTTIEYKSSTHFYLKDRKVGKPWITRLPFSVQVVSKMIVEDEVTKLRFTSQYAYHHGYYNNSEREFRGFGMVEQTDTEDYNTYQDQTESELQTTDIDSYQPPVLTKTWFHTGAYLDKERLLTHFEEEYWYNLYQQQFPDAPLTVVEPKLPDAHLTLEVQNLQGDEYREVWRACKGMMLRQEVFGLDAEQNGGTIENYKTQAKPYTVATHNCTIQLLQARGKNPYSVFLVTQSEAINLQYERDETDPRIAHTLNTEIDDLGNVKKSYAVVYGRKAAQAEKDFSILQNEISDFSKDIKEGDTVSQQQLIDAFKSNIEKTKKAQLQGHIIYTENEFANYKEGEKDIDFPHYYRTRLPRQTLTYEITGVSLSPDKLKTSAEVEQLFETTEKIAYHQSPSTGKQHRLIEHIKTQYLDDDLKTPLPFGQYDQLALPYQSYQLAYTKDLVEEIYKDKNGKLLKANGREVADLMGLKTVGNFRKEGDTFWIRSGFTSFMLKGETKVDVQNRFYLPLAFKDPFEIITKVQYDKDHLYIKETEDALGNKTIIDRFNYRTLSPTRVIDANANPSSVVFDELGMVKAMAVEGNGDLVGGDYTLIKQADSLEGYTEYTKSAEKKALQTLFSDKVVNRETTKTKALKKVGKTLLGKATTRFIYDLDNFKENKNPTRVAAIIREEHHADNADSQLQFSFDYSDGMGNVVMSKVQAEPGVAYYSNSAGEKDRKDTGEELRWIGNGRTILNNKGNPVKQYEPYFSTNFLYETEKDLVECGVTPFMHYDALSRLYRTDLPDGTFTKVAFDSWKQSSFDQNDTVLESDWYAFRQDDAAFEKEILEKYDRKPTGDWLKKLMEKEKEAVKQTVTHANTPSSIYLDSLGRPVLSVEHNGKDNKDKNRYYTTFIELDIEGNAKAVIDARGNAVMRYQYDMLGHRIYQNSSDGGERWSFNDLMGNPLHSWDAKGQVFSIKYDEFRRPTEVRLDTAIIEKMVYGENQVDDYKNNLRGQVYQQYDSSGRIENVRMDFKGSPLEIKRQLTKEHKKEIIDWKGNLSQLLEKEVFTNSSQYDALGRLKINFNWHRDNKRVAVSIPEYNERGLLKSQKQITAAEKTGDTYKKVAATKEVKAVEHIEYNEKGQRIKMKLGNGTNTHYFYDDKSFRLIQLKTTKRDGEKLPIKPSNLKDKNVFQNLYYIYDSVGNITEIEDDAIKPVYFDNGKIEPICKYEYDAIYRLTKATGRENSQFNAAPTAKEPPPIQTHFPITDKALQTYTQSYTYDPVGNILKMQHIANGGSWTRTYSYEQKNNQLIKTATNNKKATLDYKYDVHGNMLNFNATPEEYRTKWDYRDMMYQLNLGGGGTAYYQYDSQRERSRKRIEKGNITEERLYLGGMELYRKWQGEVVKEEIETHHVFVDDQRILMVEDVITTDGDLQTGILYRYQYSNHLGSVATELDEKQNIISYEEYHPYGTVAYHAKNKALKRTNKCYRYTGMERDEESGLNYHSARYYLPWLGRWLKVDPIGIGDGVNVYSYVNLNPISNKDSTGCSWEFCNPLSDADCGISSTFSVLNNFNTNTANKLNKATSGVIKNKIDESEGIVEGVLSEGEGILTLAVTAEKLSLSGITRNPQGAFDTATNIVFEVKAIVENPSIIVEGIVEPYVGALKEGKPNKAKGIAMVKAASTLYGGPKGTLGKVAAKTSKISKAKNIETKPVTSKTIKGNNKENLLKSESLLSKAKKAGVKEEIEGPIEVFIHGTNTKFADKIIETQGAVLSASKGNHGGKFYATHSLDTAKEFAERRARNVKDKVSLVGIALPENLFDKLRRSRFIVTKKISDRKGTETVFMPEAIDYLKREGFFFKL